MSVSKRVFGGAAAVVLSLGLVSCGSDPAPPVVGGDDSAVVDESVEVSETFVSDCPVIEDVEMSGVVLGESVSDADGAYCLVRLAEDNAVLSLDLTGITGYDSAVAAGYSEDQISDLTVEAVEFVLNAVMDSEALDGGDVSAVWSGLVSDGVFDLDNMPEEYEAGKYTIMHGLPVMARDGGPRVVKFDMAPYEFKVSEEGHLNVMLDGFAQYRYGENYDAFWEWALEKDPGVTVPATPEGMENAITTGGTVNIGTSYTVAFTEGGLISGLGYSYKF